MQSIIQYRRFGRQVEEQLKKDRRKADIINRKGSDGSPLTQESSTPEEREEVEDYDVDLEKAGVEASDQVERARASEAEQGKENPNNGMDDEEKHNSTQRVEDRRSGSAAVRPTVSRTTTRSGSDGASLGPTLTGVDVRDRTTNDGGDKDAKVFVVGYRGDNDSMNPHNWSFRVRLVATFQVACIGAIVGIASSIDSSALKGAAEEFGVSEVVESLSTGLYLAGFGVGGLFAGPISETLGRNPVYIATMTLFMIFVMASALAPNIGAQLTFRFFAGFFGSTPLTCAGGSIADMWDPLERVFAFSTLR